MDIFEKCLSNRHAYFTEFKQQIDRYRQLPGLEGPIAPHMKYGDKTVLVWSYNDYLGLSNHPLNRQLEKLVVAEAPTNYPMGSRYLSGNNSAYDELEKKFSKFLNYEATLLFATGYLAAVGVIPALLSVNDYVILDSDAHSCLFDAAKIAVANGAKLHVFRHNDVAHLEEHLQIAKQNNAGILIVCDGVYSMMGDLAKLKEIVALKNKYQARLFLDDAHGGGVMGANGTGTHTYFNLGSEVDIHMNTFSKAFGCTGGSISSTKPIIDYLRNNARTYIFSHNMQLVFIKKMLNSLHILQTNPSILTTLWNNTHALQAGLKQLGLDIGQSQTPITPIIFRINNLQTDVERLLTLVLKLRNEYSIYVSPVGYPAVPSNIFLLRLTVTANHTMADVETTLDAFAELKKQGFC